MAWHGTQAHPPSHVCLVHHSVIVFTPDRFAAEDRAERRRKQGLPEQLTPEEEAAERAKQAQKEAVKKKAKPPPVNMRSHGVSDALRDSLVAMKKEAGGDEGKWRTAFQTLFKYVSNIAQVCLRSCRFTARQWSLLGLARRGTTGRPEDFSSTILHIWAEDSLTSPCSSCRLTVVSRNSLRLLCCCLVKSAFLLTLLICLAVATGGKISADQL